MVEPFPLQWPDHVGRASKRDEAPFGYSLARARDDVLHQLTLLGARQVVISSNATLLKNGLPASRQAWTPDPGVAVWFVLNGRESVIACDRWLRIEDNLRAVGKTVDALRGIARWGTSQMVEAAFAGYAALPESTGGVGWWDGLGVPPNAPWDVIEANYRALVRQHHPDAGGDPELFMAINAAYEQAMAARR